MSGLVWERSPGALAADFEEYGERVQGAVAAIGEYLAPVIEAYAKSTTPWTDRTGNARQALVATAEIADDLLTIYLFHGMDYGKWLELANGGAYRVILPALTAHYGELMALAGRALRGA